MRGAGGSAASNCTRLNCSYESGRQCSPGVCNVFARSSSARGFGVGSAGCVGMTHMRPTQGMQPPQVSTLQEARAATVYSAFPVVSCRPGPCETAPSACSARETSWNAIIMANLGCSKHLGVFGGSTRHPGDVICVCVCAGLRVVAPVNLLWPRGSTPGFGLSACAIRLWQHPSCRSHGDRSKGMKIIVV